MAKPTWPPMTPAQRLDYAARLRAFANMMRDKGDFYSADINDWMATNYSRKKIDNDNNCEPK